MKKLIIKNSYLVFVGLLSLFVNSCDDSSETFSIDANPTAPVLAELNFSEIELDANNANNPALTLSWEDANYGQQLAINYAVEFSSDEAFTETVNGGSLTGKNALTLSVGELNSIASEAGLNPFEWSTLFTRVVSSLGSQKSEEVYSNVIGFSVYPFFNYPYKEYYLVGNATAPGWDNNNNNPPLFRDVNDPNTYSYSGKFVNGQFKVLEFPGLWQPQWGTNDGTLSDGVYSGSIDVNPGGGTDPGTFPNNNTDANAGSYTFTVNFTTKEYTLSTFDAPNTPSPASLSIEGSGVKDGAPKAFTALPSDSHIWYVNNVRLKPGTVSFVTDSGSSWGSEIAFGGIATENGEDIPVIVEADYNVWFNDLTGQYIFIPLDL